MRTQQDQRNFEKLTGKVLAFPQLPDGSYSAAGFSFGNVTMHKQTTAVESVKGKFHGRNGISTTVREDVKSLDTKFEFTLNEHFKEVDLIRLYGKDNAVVTQAAAVAATVAIADVEKRGIYPIAGKFGVTDVLVAIAAAAKIVGVRDEEGNIVPANADVVLEAQDGTLEILETGTIASGADLDVTYTCPALTMGSVTAGVRHKRRCRFRLTQFDGRTLPFRHQYQFDGDLTCTDQGEQNPEGEFNTFKFEVSVSGDFIVITNE